jgi:hypothetical protein
MSLSAFLAENALPTERIYCPASKRFVDAEGVPMKWELACISSTEDEKMRADAMKRVPVVGKRGQFTQELDYNTYLGRLAARCTVYPDLNNADLQNSYGVMGADVLLKTMLTPGEYTDYLVRVQEVNGFDVSFSEQVEEAKN